MNNQPIGVLDSGLGGLTIWEEIARQLPHESMVYIADSLNCPYGTKDKDQIYSMSKKMVEFLLKKDAKLIVIACNTITVSCLDKLRTDFPKVPIVGTVPVIKTAAAITKNKRIGILATTRTTKSAYQKELINKFVLGSVVFSHGTDELVPMIEKGEIKGAKINKVLQNVLAKFQKEKIDTLVLGCSHFPFLRSTIEKMLGQSVSILDSGGAIARQVKRVLGHNDSLAKKSNNPQYKFFTTGQTKNFEKITKLLKKGALIENVKRIDL